jgi:Protein of unknown function, DUF547
VYPVPQLDEEDPRFPQVVMPLEPRIHFALTCASRSCPPIAFYDAKKVHEQLDLATANFLTGGGCEVDAAQRTATISTIFKWYAGDFEEVGGVLAFLARHHPDAATRAVLGDKEHPPRLSYSPYDWNLNKA